MYIIDAICKANWSRTDSKTQKLNILLRGRSLESFSTGYINLVRGMSGEHATDTYFGAGNTQETYGHQHSSNRHLVVAELDSVQVLHAQTPRCDQAIKGKDFVHLDGRYERTTSLSDNMSD